MRDSDTISTLLLCLFTLQKKKSEYPANATHHKCTSISKSFIQKPMAADSRLLSGIEAAAAIMEFVSDAICRVTLSDNRHCCGNS